MFVCHVTFDAGKSVPHHPTVSPPLTFNICDHGEKLAIDLFAVHRQKCSTVLAKQVRGENDTKINP